MFSSAQNSLEVFSQDLFNFCDESTPLVILGDFNARTGTLPDNLDINTNFDNSNITPTNFLARYNCDENINGQGKKLVDLLTASNLRILNGRKSGDSIGNFTTFKNGHNSVNDYGIVSNNTFDRVENFSVMPQKDFSDHAEIVVSIQNVKLREQNNPSVNETWTYLEKRVIWDRESLENFQKNLENLPDAMLENFNNLILEKNESEASKTLLKVIEEALPENSKPKHLAKPIPQRGKYQKRKRINKNKNKIWFDEELSSLKKETNRLANLKHSNPKNNNFHASHHEALKIYRKMCKSKRAAFREESFKDMQKSIHDSENLWKKFKTFSECRVPKSTVTEKITADEWKNHFQKLHTESREQKVPLIAENSPTESLNKPFSMEELSKVIKKMKNKKAEGIDKIANEMIKFFPEKILEALLELYNLYLEKGIIVDNWCEGLLCPLYKENEKNNPDNYRGSVYQMHY